MKKTGYGRICQRVQIKSESEKKKNTILILIIGKAFYRRERLTNRPKTHSISEVKLMSGVPQLPALGSILAGTKSAFFTVMASTLSPKQLPEPATPGNT